MAGCDEEKKFYSPGQNIGGEEKAGACGTEALRVPEELRWKIPTAVEPPEPEPDVIPLYNRAVDAECKHIYDSEDEDSIYRNVLGDPVHLDAGMYSSAYRITSIDGITEETLSYIVKHNRVEWLKSYLNTPGYYTHAPYDKSKHVVAKKTGLTLKQADQLLRETELIVDQLDIRAVQFAQSMLQCFWLNATQTADCDENNVSCNGSDVEACWEETLEWKVWDDMGIHARTVAAGTIRSTVSQEDADLRALEMARNGLVCRFLSREVTATCESAYDMPDVLSDGKTADLHPIFSGLEPRVASVSIPNGTYTSIVSVEDATRRAEKAATDMLVCYYVNDAVERRCADATAGVLETAYSDDGMKYSIVQREADPKASPQQKGNHVVLPPGVVTSMISKEDATQTAIRLADSLLECCFVNRPLLVECPTQAVTEDDGTIKKDALGNEVYVQASEEYSNPHQYVVNSGLFFSCDPFGAEDSSADVEANSFGSQAMADEQAAASVSSALNCRYCNEAVLPSCVPAWVEAACNAGVELVTDIVIPAGTKIAAGSVCILRTAMEYNRGEEVSAGVKIRRGTLCTPKASFVDDDGPVEAGVQYIMKKTGALPVSVVLDAPMSWPSGAEYTMDTTYSLKVDAKLLAGSLYILPLPLEPDNIINPFTGEQEDVAAWSQDATQGTPAESYCTESINTSNSLAELEGAKTIKTVQAGGVQTCNYSNVKVIVTCSGGDPFTQCPSCHPYFSHDMQLESLTSFESETSNESGSEDIWDFMSWTTGFMPKTNERFIFGSASSGAPWDDVLSYPNCASYLVIEAGLFVSTEGQEAADEQAMAMACAMMRCVHSHPEIRLYCPMEGKDYVSIGHVWHPTPYGTLSDTCVQRASMTDDDEECVPCRQAPYVPYVQPDSNLSIALPAPVELPSDNKVRSFGKDVIGEATGSGYFFFTGVEDNLYKLAPWWAYTSAITTNASAIEQFPDVLPSYVGPALPYKGVHTSYMYAPGSNVMRELYGDMSQDTMLDDNPVIIAARTVTMINSGSNYECWKKAKNLGMSMLYCQYCAPGVVVSAGGGASCCPDQDAMNACTSTPDDKDDDDKIKCSLEENGISNPTAYLPGCWFYGDTKAEALAKRDCFLASISGLFSSGDSGGDGCLYGNDELSSTTTCKGGNSSGDCTSIGNGDSVTVAKNSYVAASKAEANKAAENDLKTLATVTCTYTYKESCDDASGCEPAEGGFVLQDSTTSNAPTTATGSGASCAEAQQAAQTACQAAGAGVCTYCNAEIKGECGNEDIPECTYSVTSAAGMDSLQQTLDALKEQATKCIVKNAAVTSSCEEKCGAAAAVTIETASAGGEDNSDPMPWHPSGSGSGSGTSVPASWIQLMAMTVAAGTFTKEVSQGEEAEAQQEVDEAAKNLAKSMTACIRDIAPVTFTPLEIGANQCGSNKATSEWLRSLKLTIGGYATLAGCGGGGDGGDDGDDGDYRS